MKRSMTLCLMLFLCLGAHAQQRYNSRLYLRQFSNEYVKVQQKDIRYRTVKIRNEDPKKVQAYRTSVIEQIEASKEEIEGLHPYKEDNSLILDYSRGLDSLLKAYTVSMDSALKLERYEFESYDQMNAFYSFEDLLEKKLDSAYAILQTAEDRFAERQEIGIRRDEEISEQYKLVRAVNEHLRQTNLSFYKVDHALHSFVDTVRKNTNKNLDTFLLPESVDRIMIFAEEEVDKAKDYIYPELKNSLQKELVSYLKKINKECQKTLLPIAYNLEAEPFHTNEHRNYRIDLDFFMQHYNGMTKDYLQQRESYIAKYFPD